MLYNQLIQKSQNEKMMAVLVDPDKHNELSLKKLVETSNRSDIDFFLIGGSLISKSINDSILFIKQLSNIPVFLFPGSLLQLCEHADGIFLLSLISGRNPEFLIGNHVQAAPFLKKSGMEVIPTGYMLVDCGTRTSVEYMSNTTPIPANKTDIAVATAIAGEMCGHKIIYLEGGSGAGMPVNSKLIKEVKKNISIPLIVGGGIRTAQQACEVYLAGADLIVIGTIAEESVEMISVMAKTRSTYKPVANLQFQQ